MWTLLFACVTDPPEKPSTDAVVDSALDSAQDSAQDSDCPPQDWFEDQDQDLSLIHI